MQEMQAKIADLVVEGRAGGGLVTVTLNGKGRDARHQDRPSLITDDISVVEDLIVAAHNDAKRQGRVRNEFQDAGADGSACRCLRA